MASSNGSLVSSRYTSSILRVSHASAASARDLALAEVAALPQRNDFVEDSQKGLRGVGDKLHSKGAVLAVLFVVHLRFNNDPEAVPS